MDFGGGGGNENGDSDDYHDRQIVDCHVCDDWSVDDTVIWLVMVEIVVTDNADIGGDDVYKELGSNKKVYFWIGLCDDVIVCVCG